MPLLFFELLIKIIHLFYPHRNTGWPKNGTICIVRLNFVKYWPIFKLVSLSESGEHL